MQSPEVSKENAENAERYAYYKAHPKEYLKAAIAPANLSNWVLAFLGIIGGLVAILTLFVIKRQLDMFISKERARLTVEFGSFEFPEPNTLGSVDFTVTNYGSTNAFISSAKCLVCVREAQWDLKGIRIMYEMKLPRAVAPRPEGVKEFQLIDAGSRMFGEIDGDTYNALQFRKKQMYVIGHIEFWDVFDNRWRLRFCRRWGGNYSVGQWWFTHEWLDYGEDTNGEDKIEKPSKIRRFVRWILRRPIDASVIRKAN
jgi:hypothetical protein